MSTSDLKSLRDLEILLHACEDLSITISLRLELDLEGQIRSPTYVRVFQDHETPQATGRNRMEKSEMSSASNECVALRLESRLESGIFRTCVRARMESWGRWTRMEDRKEPSWDKGMDRGSDDEVCSVTPLTYAFPFHPSYTCMLDP